MAKVSKEVISIRVSRAALGRLRASGPGWQTRLAAVIDAIAEGMPEPERLIIRDRLTEVRKRKAARLAAESKAVRA